MLTLSFSCLQKWRAVWRPRYVSSRTFLREASQWVHVPLPPVPDRHTYVPGLQVCPAGDEGLDGYVAQATGIWTNRRTGLQTQAANHHEARPPSSVESFQSKNWLVHQWWQRKYQFNPVNSNSILHDFCWAESMWFISSTSLRHFQHWVPQRSISYLWT